MSFFVDRNGWRTRSDWKIEWEGNPQAFAFFQPYILAFEPGFVEVRHIDNGGLMLILTARNIRMLHSSTREVCVFPLFFFLFPSPFFLTFGFIWLGFLVVY